MLHQQNQGCPQLPPPSPTSGLFFVSMEDGDGEIFEDDFEHVDIVLVPCPSCGRNFNSASLQKHLPICRKVSNNSKRRGVFNSNKQRLDALGDDAAHALKAAAAAAASSNGAGGGGGGRSEKKSAPSNHWKQKHSDLVAAVRAARHAQQARKNMKRRRRRRREKKTGKERGGGGGEGWERRRGGERGPGEGDEQTIFFQPRMLLAPRITQVLAAGGSVADLPPPPRSENPDYVTCDFCSRRFDPHVAQVGCHAFFFIPFFIFLLFVNSCNYLVLFFL